MPTLSRALPEKEDLARLYAEVGWTSYTQDIESLYEALTHCFVVTAWDEGRLVGLARALTDLLYDCLPARCSGEPGLSQAGDW